MMVRYICVEAPQNIWELENPVWATVYLKAQLSPVHFILGSNVAPPTTAQRELRGHKMQQASHLHPRWLAFLENDQNCNKTYLSLCLPLPVLWYGPQKKPNSIRYPVHLHSPSRSTLQDPLSLSLATFCSGAELYGLPRGSLAHWLPVGFGQWETPAGDQRVREEWV